MFVYNKPRVTKPKKQGKFIAKVPMKMIFIDESGQAFEYRNGNYIYLFCTYFVKPKAS